MKKKTPGSRALEKAYSDLEWAGRVLNESVVPASVNIDKLITSIREACELRLRERQADDKPQE